MKLRSLPAGVNSIASQALSSVRSLAFLVIAARSLSPDQFGYVAIVTTATIALNEVLRAAASHPLALMFDDVSTDDDGPLASAVSFHLLVASVAGVVAAGVLLVGGPEGGSSLVAGCLVYGLVAWLDALRTGSINRGRADRSVKIDAIWTVLLLGVLPFALERWSSALAAVLVWGATAGLSALATTLLCRLPVSVQSAASYWARVRDVARPLVGQVGLESVPSRLGPLAIAAIVGTQAAGSIRGAEVLMGGAAMVYSGVSAASLRLAREQFVSDSFRSVVRSVAKQYGVVLAAVGVNLAIVLVLPERLGVALLGESWGGASSFAPIQALVLASLVVFAIVSVVMRASLAMGALVRIDLAGAVLASLLVPSATVLGGGKVGLAMIALVALAMALIGGRWIARFDPFGVRV